jgi:hypothetical protein
VPVERRFSIGTSFAQGLGGAGGLARPLINQPIARPLGQSHRIEGYLAFGFV